MCDEADAEHAAGPTRRLQWAADGLHHAQRSCRPGHLTRVGREDRRRLEAARDRYDGVAAEQGQRQAWLEAHADTLAYREELAEAIAKRRRELGVAAAMTQPDHVVDLIGAVPRDNSASLQRWTAMAGHIEAYREEWGVAPQRLTERPRDLCRGRAWEAAVHTAQVARTTRARAGAGPGPGARPGVVTGGWAITSSPAASLGVQCPAEDCPGPSRVRWRRATPALDCPLARGGATARQGRREAIGPGTCDPPW